MLWLKGKQSVKTGQTQAVPAQAVPAQEDGPLGVRSSRPRPDRAKAQQPPAQDLRLRYAGCYTGKDRCAHRLNPPPFSFVRSSLRLLPPRGVVCGVGGWILRQSTTCACCTTPRHSDTVLREAKDGTARGLPPARTLSKSSRSCYLIRLFLVIVYSQPPCSHVWQTS